MAHKCGKCGLTRAALMERLWNGPNGYRRYKLCERCIKELGPQAVRPQTRRPWGAATRKGKPEAERGGKEWS